MSTPTIKAGTMFEPVRICLPVGTVITCRNGGLVMKSGISGTMRLVTKAEFKGESCWKAISAIDLPDGFLVKAGDEEGAAE